MELNHHLEHLKSEISERDRTDTERVISPLRQAEDAILIDTTSMSIDEVAEKISRLAEERLKQNEFISFWKSSL